jgi:uncharacterized coiled-coil DUF342 family protein
MSFDEIYKKRIENKCNISVPKKLYNTLIHKINDLDGQIRNHSIVINQMSEIIEEINNSMNEEMNNKISEITSQIELIDDKAKTIDEEVHNIKDENTKEQQLLELIDSQLKENNDLRKQNEYLNSEYIEMTEHTKKLESELMKELEVQLTVKPEEEVKQLKKIQDPTPRRVKSTTVQRKPPTVRRVQSTTSNKSVPSLDLKKTQPRKFLRRGDGLKPHQKLRS